MAQDPLCGMKVNEATAKHSMHFAGTTWYFCSGGCRKAFELQPKKYLDPGYKPSMKGAFLDWLKAIMKRPAR